MRRFHLSPKIKILLVVKTLISIVGFYYLIRISPLTEDKTTEDKATQSQDKLPDPYERCIQPELEIYPAEIDALIVKRSKLTKAKCSWEPNWILVRGPVVTLNPGAQYIHGNIECDLTGLFNEEIPDMKKNITEKYILKTTDFIQAQCKAKNNKTWHSVIHGIRYDEDLVNSVSWNRISKEGLKLNVLIIGIDSMSKLHFRRKLPQAYQFITGELKGIILDGYNVVGDTNSLNAMLSGDTSDRCSYIWDEFHANGYATAYFEDDSNLTSFSYCNIDNVSPAHTMTHFYKALQGSMQNKGCFGTKPVHKVLLKQIVNVFDVYVNKPKFISSFHSGLSRDDYNKIQLADDDLTDLLMLLADNRELYETVVIVTSNHGSSLPSVLSTEQGKIEELLPFCAFIFPPWFSTEYPQAYENLQQNADRLTTPYDVHKTLRNILHYEGSQFQQFGGENKEKAYSLLQEIPEDRSCKDAGIPPQQCSCIGQSQ